NLPAVSIVGRRPPLQGISAAVIKPLHGVAVEALVADLHPGAQRTHRGKVFDCEANRLCRGREAPIAQRLPRAALALGHEQFGGCAVVECHGLLSGPSRTMGSDAREPSCRQTLTCTRRGCAQAFEPSRGLASSGIAVELALLDDPLVRFVGALDAILTVIAFRRQKLRDF